MMDQEIKEKWLTALRSGKYEQGETYLRSTQNKFCCLGVLCDIIDPDAWVIEPTGQSYAFKGDNCLLPRHAWRAARLYSSNVRYNGKTRSLMDLNDNLGLDFRQIADIVEEQL